MHIIMNSCKLILERSTPWSNLHFYGGTQDTHVFQVNPRRRSQGNICFASIRSCWLVQSSKVPKMKMTPVEFLQYFVGGVSKLQSTPIVAVYLLFVALSPIWIRNVRPLGLRKVLVVYNFACSLISLYSVAVIVAALARNWPRSLFSREEDALVKHGIWVYYMTKYIELMDTVFMVVRHRQRQISLLHVFHHASMVMISEYACTYGNWPSVSVPLGLNGIIHVLLYYYYGQSALTPGQRPAWKKSLTQLQLIQFMIGLCHMLVGYLHHGFCYYGILYELTMIWLFSNFYYQAYIKERAAVKKLE